MPNLCILLDTLNQAQTLTQREESKYFAIDDLKQTLLKDLTGARISEIIDSTKPGSDL